LRQQEFRSDDELDTLATLFDRLLAGLADSEGPTVA
jgi:hypothetical protein